MEHHHHPSPAATDYLNKAFLGGIILNSAFVIVEFIAGLRLDSLALLSDAGHNFSDVISLILAMLAFRLAKVRPNSRYTYGYKKSTVLVSLLNACILLVAVGVILAESIKKLYQPEHLEGNTIAWVAGIGIVINAFTAWLFLKDKEKDLNVKGAYLHMAADTLVSAGVLVAGIVIQHTGWYIIDPLISIAIALIILISTAGLLLDSLRLSLDGVPSGIEPLHIRETLLKAEPEIRDIHHIHIWAISTTENALTAHIVVNPGTCMEELKHRLKHKLEQENIGHVTLEFEFPEEKCGKCCEKE